MGLLFLGIVDDRGKIFESIGQVALIPAPGDLVPFGRDSKTWRSNSIAFSRTSHTICDYNVIVVTLER